MWQTKEHCLHFGTGVTTACFHWLGNRDLEMHLLTKIVISLNIRGEALINWAGRPSAPVVLWVSKLATINDTVSLLTLRVGTDLPSRNFSTYSVAGTELFRPVIVLCGIDIKWWFKLLAVEDNWISQAPLES